MLSTNDLSLIGLPLILVISPISVKFNDEGQTFWRRLWRHVISNDLKSCIKRFAMKSSYYHCSKIIPFKGADREIVGFPPLNCVILKKRIFDTESHRFALPKINFCTKSTTENLLILSRCIAMLLSRTCIFSHNSRAEIEIFKWLKMISGTHLTISYSHMEGSKA